MEKKRTTSFVNMDGMLSVEVETEFSQKILKTGQKMVKKRIRNQSSAAYKLAFCALYDNVLTIGIQEVDTLSSSQMQNERQEEYDNDEYTKPL